MEYIIIKYISSRRKALYKETRYKRKRYDRLAAISSTYLLELLQDWNDLYFNFIIIIPIRNFSFFKHYKSD